MLKLSIDAYVALFVKVTGENSKKDINEALTKCGAGKIGFSGLLEKILKTAAETVAGEAGKEVIERLYDKLYYLIHAHDNKSEVSRICDEAQLKD